LVFQASVQTQQVYILTISIYSIEKENGKIAAPHWSCCFASIY